MAESFRGEDYPCAGNLSGNDKYWNCIVSWQSVNNKEEQVEWSGELAMAIKYWWTIGLYLWLNKALASIPLQQPYTLARLPLDPSCHGWSHVSPVSTNDSFPWNPSWAITWEIDDKNLKRKPKELGGQHCVLQSTKVTKTYVHDTRNMAEEFISLPVQQYK